MTTAARLRLLGFGWLSVLFWLIVAAFLVLGVRLAVSNQSDGGWDSAANLVAARNIAEGRGFTTDMVQVHVVPQELPGEESVRTPALAYALGFLDRLFGVGTVLPVLFNVCLIMLAAIALRLAVASIAPQWLANLTGILLCLSSNNFDLIRVLNNDLLIFLTVVSLLLATRACDGQLADRALAIACGVLTALFFFTKQSYVVSMVPYTIVLIGSVPNASRRRRLALLAAAGSLTLVLTAPYWATNLVRHGTLIYSPIQQLRLPARYGTEPLDKFQRTVHFGEPAPTYGSVVRELGIHRVLQRELDMLRKLMSALARRGFLTLGLVLLALPFVRRRRSRLYAVSIALTIAPLFDAIWWLPEDRYLFPLYAVGLFVAALGVSDYLAGEHELPNGLASRFRLTFAVVAAFIVAGAMLHSRWGWRSEFVAARKIGPTWAPALLRSAPDAIILTTEVPYVTWWTRRKSVIEPCGDRAQLEQVAALYRPDYYLDILPGPRVDRPPFAPGELTPVASGADWQLFRLAVRSRYTPSAVKSLTTVRRGSRCVSAAQ